MEPKAKTIIERHGFTDPDRKKPKHDEMQIWVYKNINAILRTVYPQQNLSDWSTPTMEFPVMDNRYVIGFVDIFCQSLRLGIEIKTEIPVVGDLIRQIQFYRQYLVESKWIVVSPDDRFASVLKDSDIHFFKYKNPGELF